VLFNVPDYLIDRKTANAVSRTSFDQIEGEGTNYKTRLRSRLSITCTLFSRTSTEPLAESQTTER
jgi:hypothetical protein